MNTFQELLLTVENWGKWIKYAYLKLDLVEQKNVKLSLLPFEKNTIVIILQTICHTSLSDFKIKATNSLTSFELLVDGTNLNSFKSLICDLHLEFISLCIVNSLFICEDNIKALSSSFKQLLKAIQAVIEIEKEIQFIQFHMNTLVRAE